MNGLKKSLLTIFIAVISLMQISAQDWPNLERYRAQNEALSPLKPGEERVVFMGNSITEGWKNKRPAFFEDNPFVCRGISGQTTPQMLLRFRQDVIELGPKVVVILAGTNDIAGNTGPSSLDMMMDNIVSMSELAVQNGINVVLCSVLPAYDFPWKPGQEPAPKVVKLNNMLKSYADDNDLVYVDYHTSMKDDKDGLKKNLGGDGVHPNEEGYKIMEMLVMPGIKKALTK